MRALLFLVLIFVSLAPINIRATQIDWPDLRFTLVATNLTQPTHVTHGNDGTGRLFVTEQIGRIRTISNGVLDSIPFLDITNRVALHWEEGLLSMAFPSGFRTNRHFYICYTGLDRAVTVSRFTAATNLLTADPATEEQILTIPHPEANHNGGQVAFGPDGYLYVSVGDGGWPPNPAQDPGSLLGKILRIDVESTSTGYLIPSDNPFANSPPYRPEIWALGLRNPWRLSFDRLTGDLYISDAGSWIREEINFQKAGTPGGQNYGWPFREGITNNVDSPLPYGGQALTEPIFDYDYNFFSSITGGHVSRKPTAGRLFGIYVFGAFDNYFVKGLCQRDNEWHSMTLITAAPGSPAPFRMASTFGEDEEGNLYVAHYSDGTVFLIDDSGKAVSPTFPAPDAVNGDDEFHYSQFIKVTSSIGARIHYTTNGTEPTTSDPFIVSGDVMTVTNGMIVKAQAFRNDLLPSDIVDRKFQIQVARITFEPDQGPITNGTPVKILCATPYASIHYTLDGTEPTTNSSRYTEPLIANETLNLRAKAFAPNHIEPNAQNVVLDLTTTDFEPTIVSTVAGRGFPGFTNGAASLAAFSKPYGICVDSNRVIYVTEQDNHRVRRIDPTGTVSTLAGSGTQGFLDGIGTNASFHSLSGICLANDGHLYVVDRGNQAIRKITTAGTVTTLVSNLNLGNGHLEADLFGNLYQASQKSVWKITPTGEATNFPPLNLTTHGITIDPTNGILINVGLHSIHRFLPSGATELFAGGIPGGIDGPLNQARFEAINAITITPDGNVVVAESARLRRISPSGQVSTLGGNSGEMGLNNGSGQAARFHNIFSLCVDNHSNIYVADTFNHCIRKISMDSDRDGVPDPEETSGSGFSPDFDDRTQDTDGDGQSNAMEYIAGTDPVNISSRFEVRQVEGEGNLLTLSWDGAAGKLYKILQSHDLVTWTVSGDPIACHVNGPMSVGLTILPFPAIKAYFRLGVSSR